MIARSLAALAACAAGVLAPLDSSLMAQSSGALFLLVPFGARAVGVAGAVVADTALGTEGMWWNAAALARLPKKELALHHSTTAFATSNMLAFAMPSRVLGTIAASAYIVDYGTQDATGPNGEPLGSISNAYYQFAMSYASPVGKRLGVGVSSKLVMLRFFQCSGICTNANPETGSTLAIDAGAQYTVATKIPFTIGATVRNLGPPLQAKDRDQADALPRVIQVGATTRLPAKSLADAGASIDVSADVLHADALGGVSVALGASAGYQNTYFVRGGYRHSKYGGEPSFGFGLSRGALGLDFSRVIDSNNLGVVPTYVSLKVRF